MKAFTKRRPVIEWAGSQHAYPVQKVDAPDEVKLSRPGEDETGWRRVGWGPFFQALARTHAVVVIGAGGRADEPDRGRGGTGGVGVAQAEGRAAHRPPDLIESPDGFAHRILPLEQARRELPPEAFGRPWWQTLAHEVWLTRPEPA